MQAWKRQLVIDTIFFDRHKITRPPRNNFWSVVAQQKATTWENQIMRALNHEPRLWPRDIRECVAALSDLFQDRTLAELFPGVSLDAALRIAAQTFQEFWTARKASQ